MKTYILLILSFSVLSGCYTQFALTKHDTWHDHEEYVEEYYEEDTVAVVEEATDVHVRHIYVRPIHRHGVIHYDPYWDSWDDSWDCWDYGHTNIYVTSPYYWGVWDYPWGYPYYTYGGYWGNYWHSGYNHYYDPYPYYYGNRYGHDRHYRNANFQKRSFSRRLAGRSHQIMRNPRRSDGLHTVHGVSDAQAVRPVRTASVGSDVKAGSTRPARISKTKNGDYVLTGGSGPVDAVRSPKRTSGNNDDKNIRRDRTVVRSDGKSAPDKKTVNKRKYYNTPVPINNGSSKNRSRVSNTAKKKSDNRQVSGNNKRSARIKDASKSTRMVPKRKKSDSRSSVNKSTPKSKKVSKSSSGSKSKSVKKSGSSSRKSSGRVSKPSSSSGSSSSGRVSSGSRSSGSRSSGSVSRGSGSSSRSSGSRSSGSRSSGGRSRGRR